MVLFAARSRCIFFVMRTEPIQVLSETELLGHKFTVYGTAENPLFLAKEVAECIDYAKTSQGYYDVSRMVGTVDEEEKDLRTIFVDGRNYEMWFLTEDGLYEVLMQSRKPIAKEFKKGVKEILKTIRKTGSYSAQQQLTPSELILQLAQVNVENERKMRELEAKQDQLQAEIEEIKQRTTTDLHQSTIVAYISRNSIKLDVSRYGAMGRKASALCKKRGVEPTKIHDVRWGTVKVYPDEILDVVFGMEGLPYEN